MFGGGFAPPPPSPEELHEAEVQATFTVQQFTATAVVLYLSPFVIDAISQIL